MNLDTAERLHAIVTSGRDAALATVIKAVGSTPRGVGAEMVVTGDGAIFGTVGGGSAEAETIRRAIAALGGGGPSFRERLDFTNDVAAREGMVCGGKLDVLVDIFRAADRETVDLLGRGLGSARAGGEPILLTSAGFRDSARTLIDAGDAGSAGDAGDAGNAGSAGNMGNAGGVDRTIAPDDSAGSVGSVGSVIGHKTLLLDDEPASRDRPAGIAAERVRSTQRPELVSPADGPEIFVQPIAAIPELLLLGGGHVAVPVARISSLLGFQVTVVDDRPEFASEERFPEATRVICGDFAETLRSLTISRGTHAVIATRGHAYDLDCLRELAGSKAAYVGMIGSPRKVAGVMKLLAEEGVPGEILATVHAPIGLDIGAETPEEIAVSILAEIIDMRRDGTASAVSLATLNRSPARHIPPSFSGQDASSGS